MQYNPTLHKLSNGVTVILDPMELETVNVKVLFQTGARDEQPHEYGITHFCEHMLCKGTQRFPSQKMVDEYMDYNGGAKAAATGNDHLCFYGRILAENIDILIDVLGDQIQNSLFDSKKIELERSVILDELRRALDDSGRQFGDFISKQLFNYATFSTHTLGTQETIASFSRDQMIEFLSRRISAKNCIIGISGKINNPDDVLAHLEKTFSFLKDIDISENDYIKYTPAIAHNPKKNKKNVTLRIFFPDICDKMEQTYENRFKFMCVGKFERHLIRELNEVLRRENGLVYGFSGSSAGNENCTVNGFATQTSPENIALVVALIAKNAYKIYNEQTITDEDLIRFSKKNKLINASWLESANARCDKLISFYREYKRIYDFYDTVRLSDSITRDDAIKYSRGYFDGEMSILTQGANFNDNLAEIWRENFK